MEKKLA